MTFDEVLDQVRELLQQRGRVTYRSLKLRYQLDDELLAGVTDELVKAERVAVDEDGEVLIWTGGTTVVSPQPPIPSPQPLDTPRITHHVSRAEGERRQLTVNSLTWSGPRPSRNSSTLKTIMLGYEPIRPPVTRSLRATRGIWPSIWVMACWCTLAIHCA